MPKTLTGAELQLDDGPARDSELFLVDGNNLAYRAYFALPEELATSEGMPTNALLGFTNMLFKLLTDYRPKGVAVAWDTRPVERMEQHEGYKADRRPMADLLREQFPYFRPIVEAFGYRNLEFEGWEADVVVVCDEVLEVEFAIAVEEEPVFSAGVSVLGSDPDFVSTTLPFSGPSRIAFHLAAFSSCLEMASAKCLGAACRHSLAQLAENY